MRRFFAARVQGDHSHLWLSPEESYHAVRVLRLKRQDAVLIFDADGHEYEARITNNDSERRVQVEVLSRRFPAHGRQGLTVAQAFLTKRKMDWAVEKAVELGLEGLIPLVTDYSQGVPRGLVLGRVRERWDRILRAAAKQSGCVAPVEISGLCTFGDLLSRLNEFTTAWLFHPYEADLSLKDALTRQVSAGTWPRKLLLILGPEGGFSKPEVSCAREHRIPIIGLGDTIFRAETAFIAITSTIGLFAPHSRVSPG